MSKMVEGLVKKGFIRRSDHAGDRRQIVLELSAKGTELFLEVKKLATMRLAQKFKKISAKDRAQLLAALKQIEEVLCHIGAKL